MHEYIGEKNIFLHVCTYKQNNYYLHKKKSSQVEYDVYSHKTVIFLEVIVVKLLLSYCCEVNFTS